MIIILSLNLIIYTSSKLISVYSIYRHGSRGPIKLDNNSKDFFGNYIENKGGLTSYGERMFYIIGIYNRYKYLYNLDFLNKTCNPNEIYFFSSHLDRTIMSSQSQMLGFCMNSISNKIINDNFIKFTYPPISIFNNNEMKNEINNLNKEKFSLPHNINLLPMHIYNEKDGRFLQIFSEKCKQTYFKILNDNSKINKILDKIEEEFNKIYKERFNKYKKENKYYKFGEILEITDQYLASYYAGKITKDIIKELNINEEEFLAYSNKIHYNFIIDYLFNDKKGEIYKLEVSLLLRDIINKIKENINLEKRKKSYKKFNIGSVHDATIMGIQIFMNSAFKLGNNIYNNIIDITYGGSITFEVYKDNKTIYNSNNYYIDYYINDKFIQRFNFNNFYENINNLIWDEEKIEEFCNTKTYILKKEILFLKYIITFLIFCVIIFFFLLFKANFGNNNNLSS